MTGNRVLGVGVLLLVPAAAAFLSGRPFIFPSLGPSAFALAVDGPRRNPPRKVIGGHLIGLIAGLVSYWALAPGRVLGDPCPAFSREMLCLAASGVSSVMLTTAAMLCTKTEHSPACATTLIVSLGLLSSLYDCALIMVSVVLLTLVHRALWPRRP